MTVTTRRWSWSDRVGNAGTKTSVNPSVIAVGDPVRQHLFQMPLSKRDQEVQALPSDRPDQPLTDGVYRGRPHRRLEYPYTHCSHSLVQILGKDAVPVMDQKSVRMFLGQRLAELLERPFSSRMRRHIVMKDLAPAQFHDDEYIKETESGCEHYEEVTSDDGLGMIVWHIESFNGQFRDECLNASRFTSLPDARHRIELWRRDYNEARPHSSLGYLTPVEFRNGLSFALLSVNPAKRFGRQGTLRARSRSALTPYAFCPRSSDQREGKPRRW